MTDTITYEGENQQRIGEAAADLVSSIENNLPKVPWLSNSGQQDAFREIVNIITEKANAIDADSDAKNAIAFWAMTLLYANKKSFRLATASVKNFGYAPTSIANTFVSWIGDNTHPGVVVMNNIESWKNQSKTF